VFLDGMPVAALVAGKAQTLIEVAAHDKERVRAALAGRR
jgi:hypothetical protein